MRFIKWLAEKLMADNGKTSPACESRVIDADTLATEIANEITRVLLVQREASRKTTQPLS